MGPRQYAISPPTGAQASYGSSIAAAARVSAAATRKAARLRTEPAITRRLSVVTAEPSRLPLTLRFPIPTPVSGQGNQRQR